MKTTKKLFHIQPSSYVDNMWAADSGELFEGTCKPYPFGVWEDGQIDNQELWAGKPARVVGFVADLGRQEVDLWWRDAVQDPQSVVGMYLITANSSEKGGGMATHQTAVEEVKVYEIEVEEE